MENTMFLTLDDNEMYECDGGMGRWLLPIVEGAGFIDAAVEFFQGFNKGFSDSWD